MDQEQDIPAPRPRLLGVPEMLACAGLCFVVTGVALIHVPSAIILAGFAQIAVAAALARA